MRILNSDKPRERLLPGGLALGLTQLCTLEPVGLHSCNYLTKWNLPTEEQCKPRRVEDFMVDSLQSHLNRQAVNKLPTMKDAPVEPMKKASSG